MEEGIGEDAAIDEAITKYREKRAARTEEEIEAEQEEILKKAMKQRETHEPEYVRSFP